MLPITTVGWTAVLDELNRYAHGYVAIPVVLCCRRRGFFELLETAGPLSLEAAAAKLSANPGYLRVAWRLLRSLGWLEQDAEPGRFRLGPAAAAARQIPELALDLLEFPFDRYFAGDDTASLASFIDYSKRRWGASDALLADLIDGLLVVPSLIGLAHREPADLAGAEPFATLPATPRRELTELFLDKGWMQGNGAAGLSSRGRFMVERAMNMAIVLSYRPMVSRIEELLFGNVDEVFARLSSGGEAHVDRTLNVIGSGFQHEKFFRGLDDVILSIFDRQPFSDQPEYVADMGCGDGTLLKRVFDVVREKSARGKVLDRYPLTMIGLDYNQASLDETRRTLKDVPHLTMQADIGDPGKMIEDLKAIGIDKPEGILHIRSFLDHDRPYLSPVDMDAAEARNGHRYEGVYVARDGQDIRPPLAVQSLTEHLEKWAQLRSRHGLIILEVHSLDPDTVRDYRDESESLHFDALQAFSGQLLVEADVFLLCAAEAGLFPKPEYALRYPKFLPFCRITQNWFEKRPYRARLARPEDIERLLELDEACWSEALRSSAETISKRIAANPDGNCVFEFDGRIVGVLYTQRIADADVLDRIRYTEIDALHRPGGVCLQLIAFNIDPEFQGQGLGDEFLEFGLHWLGLKAGVQQIVGVSRCRNFAAARTTLDEYVRSRDSEGRLLDPILRLHESHGARVRGLIPGYRPEDIDNLGAGVLIEYGMDRRRDGGRPDRGAKADSPMDRSGDLTIDAVQKMIASILGPKRASSVAPNRPLKEIGLDSLDLLEFRTLLSRATGRNIDPTFFFHHSTPRSISNYFGAGDSAAAAAHVAAGRALPGHGAAAAEPVAIVGASCRFPGGSNSLDEFWRLLESGRDAITEFPTDRGQSGARTSPPCVEPWQRAIRYGGFIDGVDRFDARFFDIAPREAVAMDPQQRLLLELSWEALEDAGIDPASLMESATGNFVGIFSHDYESLQLLRRKDAGSDMYFATGTNSSVAAGRIAYVFGLRGPAITVNTACSSSLVAVHLACQSLRNGECAMALASGVNLLLAPEFSEPFARANMLAPDGRCKTFDASADGYVRSEGAAVVVLKTLSRAQADGDRILAVIRGSAINQDGASNGLTAPSGPAQQNVIARALQDARLEPAEVSYVEAHGTGTSLGDPVEIGAIAAVYGRDRSADNPLVVGSLKTNMGHAEAAAGIGGLLKVVLSMRHGYIPPHLHFREVNPLIDFAGIPAEVPVDGMPWDLASTRTRIAGISSFGFSGTNSHLIVEEPPAADRVPVETERSHHVLTLSARDDTALRMQANRFAACIEEAAAPFNLADACFTANCGRAHLEHRLAVVCSDSAEAAAQLRAFAAGQDLHRGLVAAVASPRGGEPEPRTIAFVFGAEGSSYAGMGRVLYESEPVFRAAIDHCSELLEDRLGKSLAAILYAQQDDGWLEDPLLAQPALFCLQHALCRLWHAWGLAPDVVVGVGAGELAAAVEAGALGLEDGLKLIVARARCLGRLAESARLFAATGTVERVEQALQCVAGKASIAAINGRDQTVVGADANAARCLVETLAGHDIAVRPIDSRTAIGTELPSGLLDEFERDVAGIDFSVPDIEFISGTAGDLSGREALTPAYWRKHMCEPLRFDKALARLQAFRPDAVLEVGPAASLVGLVRNRIGTKPGRGGRTVEWLASLKPGVPDWQQILGSLARLHVTGARVDWRGFDRNFPRSRIALPTYAFQRERLWFDDAGQEDRSGVRRTAPEMDELLRTVRAGRLTTEAEAEQFEHDVNPVLDRICTSYVVAALQSLGWNPAAGETVSAATLSARLNIAARHGRLLERLLEMLGEDGSLSRHGSEWTVGAALAQSDPSPALAELLRAHPELRSEFALLQRCAEQLPAVLRGTCDPLQLIFPDGDLDGATHLYEDTPFSRDCNAMTTAAVREIQDAAKPGRPLRILEIGAGTGGTTAHVLPVLDQHRSDYLFTDVSPLFTARAEERFADYRFLRYGLLDISRDPAAQGYAGAEFDVILASNVLHATHDLRQTLQNARSMLAPGGYLLLVEGIEKARWIDLIFGLTEGWWSFSDSGLRTSYPLLGPEDWLAVLEECGFTGASVVPNSDLARGALFRQALVLARQPDAGSATTASRGRLLGPCVRPAMDDGLYLFDSIITLERHPWLLDHRVDGNVVFPASAYLEMVTAAAREISDSNELALRKLELREALFVDANVPRRVQLAINRTGRGEFDVRIYSAAADGGQGGDLNWQLHAQAELAAAAAEPVGVDDDFGEWPEGAEALGPGAHYEQMLSVGLDYGPQFRAIDSLRYRPGRVLATLREFEAPDDGFLIHPALADAVLQPVVTLALRERARPGDKSLWLPVACEEVRLPGRAGGSGGLRVVARLQQDADEDGMCTADAALVDADGRTVLSLRGITLKRVARSAAPRDSGILHRLVWVPGSPPAPDDGNVGESWLLAVNSPAMLPALQSICDALRAQGVDADTLALDAIETALAAAEDAAPPRQRIVYVADIAFDANPGDEMSAKPMDDQHRFCGGLLALVQSLVARDRLRVPELTVVTQNAQPTGQEFGGLALAQTPLSGFRRVIAAELPELACRHVDVDATASAAAVANLLLAESKVADDEDEVAYRNGVRFVSRLVVHGQKVPGGVDWNVRNNGRPCRLAIRHKGSLDGLALVPMEPREPGPGEVRIRVRATGLNFKDLVNVLGLRDENTEPGLECSGIVVATGPGVERFRIGDEVAAIGNGGFASFMTTDAALVVPKPAALSFERAATVPIAFLTAHYALRHLTKLGPGEKVLIHAASGGVGLAAVQLAKLVGAIVFGTAGSAAKRRYLESIGVDHVFDSRSLEFAEQIDRLTGGDGVDVVINSLAGEFIDKSFDVLGRGGRFIELGIRDIRDPTQVAQERPDVQYEAVDLAYTMATEPDRLGPMLERIFAEIENETIRPLPEVCLPVERIVSAFAHMQQARHIGKIVVTQPASGFGGQLDAVPFRDGTILITGGLGSLGIATARWLADKGARRLLLVGRSAPSADAQRQIETLRSDGVDVAVQECDVARRDEIAAVLEAANTNAAPLRSVFHLAGTLADGIVPDQSWENFETVFAPKVLGAWNLHELTKDLELDHFVLYSSWASMLGSVGQANHSAANAFLDALAHHRQALGLPALSVNWAAWAGGGAALVGDRKEQLASRGIGSFDPGTGLDLLGQLLAQGAAQVAVMPFDLDKWRARNAAAGKTHRFDELEVPHSDSAAERVATSLRDMIQAAQGSAKALQVLNEFIVRQLAQILNIPPSGIETDASFRSLGLDSLTGLELRNRLERHSGLRLSATIVWNYPSVERLADFLYRHLRGDGETDAGGGEHPEPGGDAEGLESLLDAIESVSDEDAQRMLGRKDMRDVAE